MPGDARRRPEWTPPNAPWDVTYAPAPLGVQVATIMP